MKGKEYIEKMLDLLVDMANHCTNKDTPVKNRAKCIDCALAWNFSIRSHGCLLVNIADNSDLLEDLINVCEDHDIEYKDKLNKLENILVTGDEENKQSK